jgi:hypothetical protein
MVIDPSAEDGRFHGDGTRLGQGSDPRIQLSSRRADLAFLLHMTSCILHAVADRFLVNVKSDVVHIVSEEPPWLFSESASPLSSAYVTPRAPH